METIQFNLNEKKVEADVWWFCNDWWLGDDPDLAQMECPDVSSESEIRNCWPKYMIKYWENDNFL